MDVVHLNPHELAIYRLERKHPLFLVALDLGLIVFALTGTGLALVGHRLIGLLIMLSQWAVIIAFWVIAFTTQGMSVWIAPVLLIVPILSAALTAQAARDYNQDLVLRILEARNVRALNASKRSERR